MRKSKKNIIAAVLGVLFAVGVAMLIKGTMLIWFQGQPRFMMTFSRENPIDPDKLRSYIGKSVLEIPTADLFDGQQDVAGSGTLLYQDSLAQIEKNKMAVILYDSDLKTKYRLVIDNRILKDVIAEEVTPKEREQELEFREKHPMKS